MHNILNIIVVLKCLECNHNKNLSFNIKILYFHNKITHLLLIIKLYKQYR